MTKRAKDLLIEYDKTNTTINPLSEQILELLTNKKLTLQQLYTELDATEKEIDNSIRTLLTLKYIAENSNWELYTALGGKQYLENQ